MIADSDSRTQARRGARTTKKLRLLQLAQDDPFLSVDEMAKFIGTTPRYVRTALSEAGLSLTQLRRRQAEKMKRRLRFDMSVPDTDENGVRPSGAAHHLGIEVGIGDVRVAQIVDAEIADMLQARTEAPLLEISRLRVAQEEPLYLDQLVTTQHLVVTDDIFSMEKSLVELLDLHARPDAKFAERTIDVVRADGYLSRSLKVPPNHPIVRLGNILAGGGRPIAIKFTYYDARRIRIVLADVPARAVRFVDRDDEGGGGAPAP